MSGMQGPPEKAVCTGAVGLASEGETCEVFHSRGRGEDTIGMWVCPNLPYQFLKILGKWSQCFATTIETDRLLL